MLSPLPLFCVKYLLNTYGTSYSIHTNTHTHTYLRTHTNILSRSTAGVILAHIHLYIQIPAQGGECFLCLSSFLFSVLVFLLSILQSTSVPLCLSIFIVCATGLLLSSFFTCFLIYIRFCQLLENITYLLTVTLFALATPAFSFDRVFLPSFLHFFLLLCFASLSLYLHVSVVPFCCFLFLFLFYYFFPIPYPAIKRTQISFSNSVQCA